MKPTRAVVSANMGGKREKWTIRYAMGSAQLMLKKYLYKAANVVTFLSKITLSCLLVVTFLGTTKSTLFKASII